MPPAAHKSRANLTFTQNCAMEGHATILVCAHGHGEIIDNAWSGFGRICNLTDQSLTQFLRAALIPIRHVHRLVIHRLVIHRLVIQAHRLVIHRLVIRRLVIHRLVTHTGWLYKTKVRYNQPAKYCRLVITA